MLPYHCSLDIISNQLDYETFHGQRPHTKQNVLFIRGWQFVFEGPSISRGPEVVIYDLFLLLTDFLIHNQCVTLQISVNFNISSLFMW